MRFRDLKTTDEIQTIYRFRSRHAVRRWLAYHDVPVTRRGRVLLVDTRDVDAACSRSYSRFTRTESA